VNPALATVAASARRELDFLRRAGGWTVATVSWLPCALLVMLAIVFNAGTMRDVPIAVVDDDRSAESRELIRRLDASQGVYVAARPVDLDEAWSAVRRVDVYAVVHVPRDFARAVQRGEPATVFAYYNASFLTTGQSAFRDISTVAQTYSAILSVERSAFVPGRAGPQALPVQVQATVMFNPTRSYEHFLLSLLFPALLQFGFCLACVTALSRELRDGTSIDWLERTGNRPLAATVGKLLPYFGLFMLYGAVATLWVAHRGGGIAGSTAMLMTGYAAMYFAYAAVALLLVGATRSMVLALSATGIYSGIAFAFAGAAFPTLDGPLFTRIWSQLMPYTTYVELQSQHLDIGSRALDSLPHLGVLLLFPLVAGIPGAALYLRSLRDTASWGRR
jgi:ABC-2 type transport system permease protein